MDRMERGIPIAELEDEERPNNGNATSVVSTVSATMPLERAAATTADADADADRVDHKSHSTNSNSNSNNNTNKKDAWKLCFGAAGIYVAYLVYGNVQEDLFRYRDQTDGSNFRNAWFLQVLESCANIVVGVAGRYAFGGTKGLPVLPFATSGASQVVAKVFTSLALAAGLSFPVCILAKSAKMVPVMLGQLALGGCSYTLRDYCIAAAIVGGTALLTMGEQQTQVDISDNVDNNNSDNGDNYYNNTYAGLAFILISLIMDGVTAGLQKRLQQDAATNGKIPTPYDFLLFTNVSMAATALPIAVASGDWTAGWAFCAANPAVRHMIGTCCLCSVAGQSFIFYIVAHFDPLVCSTVTTSRKIMSVVWSIATKGHSLSEQASFGLFVAVSALVLEVQGKVSYRYQQGSSRPTASKHDL
jgi:UDP-galactose transporter B1